MLNAGCTNNWEADWCKGRMVPVSKVQFVERNERRTGGQMKVAVQQLEEKKTKG